MKKLTAGIFATILGVTAMGAADAAIPSKGYVDTAVKGVADSVTTLGSNVARDYALKSELESEADTRSSQDTTLQQNIDTLAGNVYKKTETYSQAEVDALVEGVDGATAIQGINNEITLIKQEQQTQNTNITNLQNDKVSTTTLSTTLADYATTTAVNTKLADYATTTAVNTALEGKVDNATLNNYATTESVTQGLSGKVDNATLNNYATISSVKSDLAKKQENLTSAQLNAVNSGITADKISAMDKATADAQADATKALGDAAAAQGVADAAAAALNSATKISDGNYTLTMKVVGDTVSYGWELIDRGYDSADLTGNNQ